MNGFLLVLCHTMDDLPIGLFSTREELDKHVANTYPKDWDGQVNENVPNVFRSGCSTPCNLSAVEFCDGKPVGIDYLRFFEG